MEIPNQAKKCPYCHHWQYRWSTIVFNPLFGIVFLVVFIILPMSYLQSKIYETFNSREQFRGFTNQISIVDTKMEFGEDQSGPVVIIIGKMKNDSPVDWKDVRLHVDFYNGIGELIDTGQQESYNWRLPAGDETSFKMSLQRQLPEKEYSTYKVRVISAVDARQRF
jgi:hypothetical protein